VDYVGVSTPVAAGNTEQATEDTAIVKIFAVLARGNDDLD
jgi:hypothetical protein